MHVLMHELIVQQIGEWCERVSMLIFHPHVNRRAP